MVCFDIRGADVAVSIIFAPAGCDNLDQAVWSGRRPCGELPGVSWRRQ